MKRSYTSTWTLDDALRMQATLARWLRTPDGTKCAYVIGETVLEAAPGLEPPSWQRAQEEAQGTADDLAAATLIWCDPPMVDMWAAAADSYPHEPLEPHHLPDPHGIVILSRPLPRITPSTAHLDDPDHEQISAITWETNDHSDAVVVITWTRHWGSAALNWGNTPRTVLAPGLRMSSLGVRQFGGGQGENTVALIQSLTGLIRSPLTDETTDAGSKAARKEAIKAGITEPRIRRLYLRRPEQAAAELEAARDTRAGRPIRGHWVAGHWKQQFYPSINEHRWIRIEGYPRGDFTAGQVTGPKARVARGDRTKDLAP
jgi:hypothetical protein